MVHAGNSQDVATCCHGWLGALSVCQDMTFSQILLWNAEAICIRLVSIIPISRLNIDLKPILPFSPSESMILCEKAHSIVGQPQNEQIKEKYPLQKLE